MMDQLIAVQQRWGRDIAFASLLAASLIIAIFVATLSPLDAFGQPLAEGKDKFLGNVIPNGNSIRPSFKNYWNQVTPENAGKWESAEPGKDYYNWTQLDKIYNYALANNFPYKHHALVWGQQYPSWITTLDSAEQRFQVEEWIRLVGERYPRMNFVDVVNEPFNAPPPFMKALGGSGKTGWDWVVTAFQWARRYCAPEVKLILNEYNILHSNTTTDGYLQLIDTLKARGLIDAIGIQGHYFEFKSYAGASTSYSYPIATLEYNLNRLAATGLPIYISEFDINEADDNVQLQNYQTYFPLFWEHPGVKGMTLWGYVEGEIWKTNAYLLTSHGAERPALKWLRTYIASPLRPSIISPNNVSNVPRDATLIWHVSISATRYHLQVSSSSSFATTVIDTVVADTTIRLQPLEANRRFFWRVSAINQYGESPFSRTASFITGDQTSGIEPGYENSLNFELFQNYPNPFKATTTIAYEIPKECWVQLKIYDVLGHELGTLVEKKLAPGSYRMQFLADKLNSGFYFYQIKAGNFETVKRMVIIK